MKCKNCNSELLNEGKFCSNCGSPVEISVEKSLNDAEEKVSSSMDEVSGNKEGVVSNVNTSNDMNNGMEKPKVVTAENTEKKKMSKKKKIFIGIGIFILLCIIVPSGGNDKESSSSSKETSSQTSEDTNINADNSSSNEDDANKEDSDLGEPVSSEPKEINTADYETGITYDNLARTPDDYKFKKVKFYGKIIQVMEGDDGTEYRVAVNDNYDTVMYLAAEKSLIENNRLLENDHVTFYGTSVGVITYESAIGGNITIPGVKVDKFER